MTKTNFNLMAFEPSSLGNSYIGVVSYTDPELGDIRCMVEGKDLNEIQGNPNIFSIAIDNDITMHDKAITMCRTFVDIIHARISNVHDNVILGGLGAGVTHTVLVRKLKETNVPAEVVSIESDTTVISLARTYFSFEDNVIHGDFFRYVLDAPPKSFHGMLINTWSIADDTNSTTMTVPLIHQILDKIKDSGFILINCFGKDKDHQVQQLRDSISHNFGFEVLPYGPWNDLVLIQKCFNIGNNSEDSLP